MNAPLDYFLHASGPAAQPTQTLGWVFAGICLLVCLIVAALLLYAIVHKRPASEPRAIGRGGKGLRWVGIGTGVSSVILFAMAVYALVVLDISASPPTKPALVVYVTGYDWWWKAVYDEDHPAQRFETANEIHIPVGVPVMIDLSSADVIHAFWVPALAGKTQMIPGLTNHQWLQANEPGIYRGQCTQFCGAQHAHMAFEVVAQSRADFARWQQQQRQAAMMPAQKDALAGQRVFMQQCAACHTVRGSPASGLHGPDLTHLASRRLIAAGMLENDSANRQRWIAHAQEMKPGTRMPDTQLPTADASALSAYLDGLK